MGVDVNLYAIGDVTDEHLAEANEYVEARCHDWVWYDDDDAGVEATGIPLVRAPEDDGRRIQMHCALRYYGLVYGRGHWALIYGCIRALQAALPDCTVYYGADTSDEGELVTDEMLAEIWRHWLEPRGGTP